MKDARSIRVALAGAAMMIIGARVAVSSHLPSTPPPDAPASQPQAPASTQPETIELQENAAKPVHDPRYGLLTPIPEEGGLPPIFSKLYENTHNDLRQRAALRKYALQIRQIRHKYLGDVKPEKIREQGIAQIREFTDPAAFQPLIEELMGEQDDVRLALLDHFAEQRDEGQAALAWVAIHDKDAAIRNEAMRRMISPASQPVLFLVDAALRSENVDIASSAAMLTSSLNIIQAIPLLIFAQVRPTEEGRQGDLAWIAIQTQRAFVASVQPVVGDNAGGFAPVVGVVSEGSVLRVVDAVVIEYRTFVHQALVNLTTSDWGQSTAGMNYNVRDWWDWYNGVYLPFKREQAAAAALSRQSPDD